MIVHYLNMKWYKLSQKLLQNSLNSNKDSIVLGLKTKVGRILSLLHPLWEDSNAVLSVHRYIRGDVKIAFSVTTNKPQKMTNVGDWAYVTQICHWPPAEAMWQVTYAGWG